MTPSPVLEPAPRTLRGPGEWELRECDHCGRENVRRVPLKTREAEVACACGHNQFTIYDSLWIERHDGLTLALRAGEVDRFANAARDAALADLFSTFNELVRELRARGVSRVDTLTFVDQALGLIEEAVA